MFWNKPKKTIVRTIDFTITPGARLRRESKFSGEQFRQEFLEPHFLGRKKWHKNKIVIDLDGTCGYGTSFLKEAFAGLALRFGEKTVRNRLEFISEEDPLLIKEINKYISEYEVHAFGSCDDYKTVDSHEVKGYGFPVIIRDARMKNVMGEWVLDVNQRNLDHEVLKCLALENLYKTVALGNDALTGAQRKFVRHVNDITLDEMARAGRTSVIEVRRREHPEHGTELREPDPVRLCMDNDWLHMDSEPEVVKHINQKREKENGKVSN